MVPLPLFKLGSLFLRHISKYGANRIKAQAHEHPSFRAFAARYGQHMHQLNMRMSVALLRDPEAERRAKEKAEAPTVKTEEQTKRDEEAKAKEREKKEKKERQAAAQATTTATTTTQATQQATTQKPPSPKEDVTIPAPAAAATASTTMTTKAKRPLFNNVWKRKFRPLPESKAVDLFADVIGDAFILSVAVGLILYEYWKSSQKPDANKERIDELNRRFAELEDAERRQQERFESLEQALKTLKDPKTKKPLLPSIQEAPPTAAAPSPTPAV
ncbi:hypothetical protein K4F52_006456 [Lecanicillium sp. MT-2017a]|nr:hypothetical protein K4F52_006456 [Lecanicillium sp. MT-2017a]